jgi:hypothetical protein
VVEASEIPEPSQETDLRVHSSQDYRLVVKPELKLFKLKAVRSEKNAIVCLALHATAGKPSAVFYEIERAQGACGRAFFFQACPAWIDANDTAG